MLGQNNVEIKIERVYAVSRASLFLPFSVEDAARSDAEVEASQVCYQKLVSMVAWVLAVVLVGGYFW